MHRDPSTNSITKLEALFIGHTLMLALFGTHIDLHPPTPPAQQSIVITYLPPGSAPPTREALHWRGDADQVMFPVTPDIAGLDTAEVDLHGSAMRAYDMGDALRRWFGERLGAEVRLVYVGDQSRAVLGSLAPNGAAARARQGLGSRMAGWLPWAGAVEAERIAFNDLAQYLVVTEESNEDVSARLPEGLSMDVSKFRPNIVLRGAPESFDEDFWGELTFFGEEGRGGLRMQLTANCYRCQSITVDYATGKPAQGELGTVWKKLNKDRRVDKGAKWSPVFGRYGFVENREERRVLRVGDSVEVTRRNVERTVFGESFCIYAEEAR